MIYSPYILTCFFFFFSGAATANSQIVIIRVPLLSEELSVDDVINPIRVGYNKLSLNYLQSLQSSRFVKFVSHS